MGSKDRLNKMDDVMGPRDLQFNKSSRGGCCAKERSRA